MLHMRVISGVLAASLIADGFKRGDPGIAAGGPVVFSSTPRQS